MKSELKADKLVIKIYDTRAVMGAAASVDVGNKISQLLQEKYSVNMIFAAAPSQNDFLAELTKSPIEWGRVRAFHMDEYIGLEHDAPQLFGNFLKQHIFDKLPFSAVHYLNGNAANVNDECERYSALLKKYPADIVCMGIGENGHIAFNDPPVADFNDTKMVKRVTLDEPCRQQQVNDGCFTTIDKVPATAITLTIPALMAAKYIYCMVPGPTKSQAVDNTLNKEIVEQYPSTILRTHPGAILYLDGLSSSKLNKRHQ